jgi:D-glycero-D-manno-heptose 1,7-bisphosphate phosphatase
MRAGRRGMKFETVFLDRDGVINAKAAEGDYVKSWDEFRLLPGAAAAIGLLTAAGRRVIVVTNQRGIARGRFTEARLAEIHAGMRRELAVYSGRLDAIYHCPHDRGQCSCRKPATGMLEQARLEHPGLDLSRSVLVGDSLSDLECGAAAGCQVILVGSGQRTAEIANQARQQGISLLAVCDSLIQVVAAHVLQSPAPLAA